VLGCLNLSEINGYNLNNIGHETRRHFRNKKRKYLKDKINGLAMNSKNKNIGDLYIRINLCSLYTNQHKIHTTKGGAHPVVHRAAAMQKIGRTDIL
jgi:hypothetical protein